MRRGRARRHGARHPPRGGGRGARRLLPRAPSKALIGVASQTLANQERHLVQIDGFVKAGTRPEIDLAQARAGRANARVGVISAETDFTVAARRAEPGDGRRGRTDYDVADETFAAGAGRERARSARSSTRRSGRAPTSRRGQPGEGAGAGGARRARRLLAFAQPRRGRRATKAEHPADAVRSISSATRPRGGMAWNVWGGVQLTWPLFQGFLTRGQVREADADGSPPCAPSVTPWFRRCGSRSRRRRPPCAPRRRRSSRPTRR